MAKNSPSFGKAQEEYCSVLAQMTRDLSNLIYQLEADTINRVSDKLPIELEFDAIPILRKLKDAHQLSESSYHHFSRGIK